MTIDFLESIVDAFDDMTYIKKQWKIVSITENEFSVCGHPIADIVICKDGVYQSIAFMNGKLTIPQIARGTNESGFFIEDLERVLDGYLRSTHECASISKISFEKYTAFFHAGDKMIPFSRIKDMCV